MMEGATTSSVIRFPKRSMTPKPLRKLTHGLNGELIRKWSSRDHVEHSQVCSQAVCFGVEQEEVMGSERTQDLTGCRPLTFQGEESSTGWGRLVLPHPTSGRAGAARCCQFPQTAEHRCLYGLEGHCLWGSGDSAGHPLLEGGGYSVSCPFFFF